MADERSIERKRRGFWLREARDRKGLKQGDVAQRLGYSDKSASTIKKWESGERDVPTGHLARLALLYEVPAEVFVHPEPTAEERLNELARGAIALAVQDVEGEVAEGHDDDAQPAEQRGRR
jgi:transcriptional regulator with XRE-family HTH domain